VRADALLNLTLINKEELSLSVKVRGSPGCGDHKVELSEQSKKDHSPALQESRFLRVQGSVWKIPAMGDSLGEESRRAG